MRLALNIIALMEDFSKKWLVVELCSFTGHFTLDGYSEYSKWLYKYLFRQMSIPFIQI